ncbi:MAG: Arginase/agmatinase/formimionoglutamate hydrolase, arginase family, partial [uncultured Actinomycetospora sp.]
GEVRRAVRAGRDVPGRRPVRPRRPGDVGGRRRRGAGRAVRRRHLAPAGHPLRAGRHPHRLLPPARRLAAEPGPARRRPARPAGAGRRRRRDVLRRHRARPARARGGGREGRPRRGGAARPRRRPLHRLPGREGRRQRPRRRAGVDAALRRARRHRRHRVRLAVGPRAADAAAPRVGRRPGRPVPADRTARLLARPGDPGLDGRAGHAGVRDERGRRPGARRVPRGGLGARDRRLRRGLPVRRHRRGRPRARTGDGHARAGRAECPAAARRGAADLPRAARGRHRRGGGVAAVRLGGRHGAAREPRRAGGAVGHGPAPGGRPGLGPAPAAARRPGGGQRRDTRRTRRTRV